MICAFGQHRMVTGLTRCGLPLPMSILADEKHSRCLTAKVSLPTIVSGRVLWHLGYSDSQSAAAFTTYYGVLQHAALAQKPSYRVKGALTDGFDSSDAVHPVHISRSLETHAAGLVFGLGRRCNRFLAGSAACCPGGGQRLPRHAHACAPDYPARYPAPRRERAAARSGTLLEEAANRGDVVTASAAAAASCSVILASSVCSPLYQPLPFPLLRPVGPAAGASWQGSRRWARARWRRFRWHRAGERGGAPARATAGAACWGVRLA